MNKKILLLVLTLFSVGTLMAQTTVSGKVTSGADNSPLVGVTVLVKGTSTGTQTDIDGNYTLDVPSSESVLQFMFIGFATQDITVGSQTTINVKLVEDTKLLDEVVVVGYGEQLKVDLTGNIAKVSGKDLENVPVPSLESAVQGRAAGVFVESGNGKVGQGIKIRIRGASSISASSQPLYIIDGMPVTSQSGSTNSDSQINPLADINSNDIESIDILKDASAAAIYGSRGANGVVIITTKKGKTGKTKFNLGYQVGSSSPTGKREFLNAQEYVELFLEAGRNSSWADQEYVEGRLNRYSGDPTGNSWRNNLVDTDWQGQAFQDAPFHQIDLSMNGGNEKTQFYVSGSYLDQNGILIGNRFRRFSTRINLDHQISNKFKVGVSMGLSRTINDRLSDDNSFATPIQLVALSPITPLRDETGEYTRRPTSVYYNGLLSSKYADYVSNNYRNLTNAYGSYEIMKGWTVRGEFGTDIMTRNEDAFYGRQTIASDGRDGVGVSEWIQVLNYNTKLYTNYTKNIAEKHDITVTAGMEYQYSREDVTYVDGQDFPVDDLKKLASAATISTGFSQLTQFSFVSYFGRVNYKFNNRYLFGVSARQDGSSRFGKNSRYGFFPAISAGWIVTEEDFLKDNGIVSFLKLRGSFGLTGNAEIGNFPQLGLYGGEPYAGNAGLQPTQIPNPDLRWEQTAQLDIGIDFGFMNDRITGEIDYYSKNTTDLLLNVPVPGTTGFRSQTQNIGELENKGLEFALNASILTGDLKWNVNFNFATNQNKVLSLGNDDIIDNGGSRWLNVVKVGEAIGAFYGAEYAGADPNNGDALWYINDPENMSSRETTNNFNDANFMILGNPNPKHIGGFGNNLSYKGFDLSILLQWVYGNSIFNGGGGFMSAAGDWFDNQTKDQLRRWQNPGDVTDVPQARLGDGNGTQGRSSRYLSDGSYLRLKNLNFGYNVPKSALEKLKLDNARIYIAGQNLLTFTKYEGWDPEVNTDYLGTSNQNRNIFQGNDFYAAPQARTITLGVKLGF